MKTFAEWLAMNSTSTLADYEAYQRQPRIEALQATIRALREQLEAAEAELLEVRFQGVPRHPVGTVVLVPRMLFGQRKMWPARIASVHLRYIPDHAGTGEKKLVGYSVFFQQKDGSFGGSSDGAWHDEVVLPPPDTSCPGSDQPWGTGTGNPICPACHRGPAGLDVRPPLHRQGRWTGKVPAHTRMT